MDRYCEAPCLLAHRPQGCVRGECLVSAAVGGDEAAQEELFGKLQPFVLGQAQVLCRHQADAEDLAQDCILHAVQRIGQLRDHQKLGAWIWKILQNEHRMVLRRRRSPPRELEPLDEGRVSAAVALSPDALRLISAEEFQQGMQSQLATLSGNLQQVVKLRLLDGNTTTQTAVQLGVTKEVVRTRLTRARRALRRGIA